MGYRPPSKQTLKFVKFNDRNSGEIVKARVYLYVSVRYTLHAAHCARKYVIAW